MPNDQPAADRTIFNRFAARYNALNEKPLRRTPLITTDAGLGIDCKKAVRNAQTWSAVGATRESNTTAPRSLLVKTDEAFHRHSR